MMKPVYSLAGLGVVCAVLFAGADWRQFRGADGSSVARGPAPPESWSEGENIAWKIDLPGRGASSPIVVDGKVIVTCSSGFRQDRLHVIAFDAATGRELWQRQFWATGRTNCHPMSCIAAPTPASDELRILAFYSSNDLVCLDLDGNLLWMRGLTHESPTAANDTGMASSPLIVDDLVVVQVENEGDSFAAGIDRRTGVTLWRIERPRMQNWTSPTAAPGEQTQNRAKDDDIVLLQSPDRLTAHRSRTGETLWTFEAECNTIASPTSDGESIFVVADGLAALDAGARDSVNERWREPKLASGASTPVVHDGRVYVLNNAGALSCGDTSTGELLWRLRLEGRFWATPVLAGDSLYCTNQEGVVQVVRVSGEEGEVIARNEFGESILGSPAVADGALYFRSDQHLWKIARP